ncbi:hypothetical protein ACWEQL_42240, partial [Kitasatospora sp. NPDC004240]
MARGGKAFKALAKGMALVASAAAVIERRRRAAMAADPAEPVRPLELAPVPVAVAVAPEPAEAPGAAAPAG